MRTFKKVTAFVLLNAIIICLLNFAFSQPSIVDIELSEIQGATNYDVVVIGQSHGETTISPQILDDRLEIESYNCARRLMSVKNLYYMLREINYNNDVKTVLLELDYTYWISDNTSYGTDTTMLFHCNNPKNKLDYLMNETGDGHFLNLIADFSVYMEDVKRAPDVIKMKLSKEYIDKDPEVIRLINENIIKAIKYKYRGKGFKYGIDNYNKGYSDGIGLLEFSEAEVKQKNIEVFNNVVDYCKENNIELICFTTALPSERLKNDAYNEIHDYFTQLTSERNVQYIDLNYCKSQYLKRVNSRADFVDIDGHPKGRFAERQTQVLCDILLSKNPDEYFYSSYTDVLKALD